MIDETKAMETDDVPESEGMEAAMTEERKIARALDLDRVDMRQELRLALQRDRHEERREFARALQRQREEKRRERERQLERQREEEKRERGQDVLRDWEEERRQRVQTQENDWDDERRPRNWGLVDDDLQKRILERVRHERELLERERVKLLYLKREMLRREKEGLKRQLRLEEARRQRSGYFGGSEDRRKNRVPVDSLRSQEPGIHEHMCPPIDSNNQYGEDTYIHL